MTERFKMPYILYPKPILLPKDYLNIYKIIDVVMLENYWVNTK